MKHYIIIEEDLDRLEHYIGEHNYLAHGWISNMRDNRQVEEVTHENIIHITSVDSLFVKEGKQ